MGWLNILGTLAQAVVGQTQRRTVYQDHPRAISRAGSGPEPRGLEGNYRILSPEEEVAQAEAETKRMLEEAYLEMIDERVEVGIRRVEEQMSRASGKVIDLETQVGTRIDSMHRSLDAIQLHTSDLESLGRKVNVLLAAVVLIAAISVYLLYRSF